MGSAVGGSSVKSLDCAAWSGRRRHRRPGLDDRPPVAAAVLLCAALLVAHGLAAPARAEGDPAPTPTGQTDGPAYEVDHFELSYREAHPDQPPLERILPLRVQLQATETGYVAPRPGGVREPVTVTGDEQPPARYHASAIGRIARAALEALHEEGLLGVYVQPSAEDIDAGSERDLREPGNRRLRLSIWIGRITDVRTVALGERVEGSWRIDNPLHRHIREGSPLQPAGSGRPGSSDLMRRDELEEYLFRLNRHPGRHVEATLGSSKDGDGITLDYRIFEPRPWTAYAQVSNTGTERTNLWQSRWGYIHRQLSNHDDVLSIEYTNSGFNDVNGVNVSYEAPWFRRRRPSWMESSGREPDWIAWADRSKIPWWGLSRLRWGVDGSWTRIDAGHAGQLPGGFGAVDQVLSQDWSVGGQISYNAWQHRSLFLDVFLGGRFRGIEVDNRSLGDRNRGKVTVFLAEAGVEIERVNLYSTLLARFSAERGGPVGGRESYAEDFASNLGRAATDPRWWALRWNVGASHYLEPLLNPSAWRDPSTTGSSKLSHEVSLGLRGQYGFDYRLIPQVSQVIGGLYSVRGFPQSVAVGDSVYVGSFEYRFHIPRALPIRPEPLRLPWIGDFRVAPQQVYGRPDWDLVLRGFVDAGRSIRNDRGSRRELNQTLVGAGVGLEFVFRGRLRARVDWGRGLYQDTQCPRGVACGSQDDIDPQGEFHFLFSLMY